ncbi:MAG: CBO0543 family protein [Bacillota bacterium]
MHLGVIILTIFAAWQKGDWKNWERYHSTMLFVAMSNLLYNFIYFNHFLWQLKPDFLFNHVMGEMFYTFIVFPFSAFILLSNYPKDLKKQVYRIAKFITVYILIEWIFLEYGRIVHKYGWNMWWSLAWDCMMFPIWVLHYKKPLIAYFVSFVVVVVVVLLFPPNFY